MINDDTGIRRIDEVLDFLYDIFLDVCMIGPAVGAAYPSVQRRDIIIDHLSLFKRRVNDDLVSNNCGIRYFIRVLQMVMTHEVRHHRFLLSLHLFSDESVIIMRFEDDGILAVVQCCSVVGKRDLLVEVR